LHLLVYLLEYMKIHGPGNIKFVKFLVAILQVFRTAIREVICDSNFYPDGAFLSIWGFLRLTAVHVSYLRKCVAPNINSTKLWKLFGACRISPKTSWEVAIPAVKCGLVHCDTFCTDIGCLWRKYTQNTSVFRCLFFARDLWELQMSWWMCPCNTVYFIRFSLILR
jgi:hypothetical protein